MERYTEKAAADILLDRGVRIPIPAPFFLRWFGKKEISFTVRRPRYGTGMRISSYYISTGITEDKTKEITANDALRLYKDHGEVLSKIVACGILNDWLLGMFLTRILAWYLRERSTADRICHLANFLVVFGTASPFMNTIRSVQKLVITAPNLSQTTQGS